MGDTVSEISRYLVVAVIALIADLSVFSFSLRIMGLAWYWAASAGFVVGAVTAYWLSIRFVFRLRRLKHAPRREFATFFLVGVGGLLVTQLVLWVGIELLGLNAELTRFGAAFLTFAANYAARKLLLFYSRQGAAE